MQRVHEYPPRADGKRGFQVVLWVPSSGKHSKLSPYFITTLDINAFSKDEAVNRAARDPFPMAPRGQVSPPVAKAEIEKEYNGPVELVNFGYREGREARQEIREAEKLDNLAFLGYEE